MDSLVNANPTERQLSQPKKPESRSKKPAANSLSTKVDRQVLNSRSRSRLQFVDRPMS